ncbi:Acyl-CoA N-acyltransferase [Penicillium angulare]|uniref:Acyl-CoA N-acyltransferase n=1 Tax=Penicillium angulare TaxID=116970 RepID=A0A9W9ESQ8_9EURO|nr:Acyl-CoA N-acyltransferase [Penicillium angulare]
MVSSDDFVLPQEYSLHFGYPSVTDYLDLRSATGLSPKTPSQAAAISTGSWFGCYITFDTGHGSEIIGMGRVIGDGGWYFHIADMAVHPRHQKKGLGDIVLKVLLQRINQEAPNDGKPYISLFADEAGKRLYFKNGFVEAAPGQLGMVLKS